LEQEAGISVGVQQGLCENVRGAAVPIGLLNRRLGSLLGSQDKLWENAHGAKGPIGLLNRRLGFLWGFNKGFVKTCAALRDQ